MMDKQLKIVAICGSPHKRNTYDVLRMLQAHHTTVDFKILMLSEVDLQDCLGCYTCINIGEENCPLKDDRDLLIEAMTTADATIFASPTYARTISALMKKFVERISYISHRPVFFGKYAMALTTCKGFGADLTCKYLVENFTQSGFAFVPSAELKVATKSETETAYNHKKAIARYDVLLKAVRSHQKFKPSLGQLVYFNIFKGIATMNKKKGWADYRFYKNKKDFYDDSKIPLLKNTIAKWLANRELKKMKAHK